MTAPLRSRLGSGSGTLNTCNGLRDAGRYGSVLLKTALALIPLAILLLPTGCSDEFMAAHDWDGLRWFRPKGEPWTIQCLVLSGLDRRKTAESVADTLRNTARIDRRNIELEHGEHESTIYYGKYMRPIDAKTRRLEVTEAMDRDMRIIKELGVPGQGHYFADAKFVPVPTPDVGNSEWALDRANGVYSLRVAIFANEPGFYERKKAAAEYTAMLRKEGYPAFYRHGQIHSEVLVGELGEDALTPVARKSDPSKRTLVGFDLPSPEVRTLRKNRDFAFELFNLRKRSERVGNRKVYAASQLVRIRDALPEEQW